MPSSKFSRLAAAAIVATLMGVAATAPTAATSSRAAKSLLRSAIALDARNETITLPLFKGRTAAGKTTWYVVTDSSSRADASHRGVNFAPRLKNALGTKAVQKARSVGGSFASRGPSTSAPSGRWFPVPKAFRQRQRSPAPSATRATARS